MGIFGNKKSGGSSLRVMTPAHMEQIVRQLDENPKIDGNQINFEIRERPLIIVYDQNADRMRIISPIVPIEDVPEEIYKRLLQANFDSALDCRYAIANDLIWSAFLHPLSSLTEDDLISGILQTLSAAETFGSSYSSGGLIFAGGDTEIIDNQDDDLGLPRKPSDIH